MKVGNQKTAIILCLLLVFFLSNMNNSIFLGLSKEITSNSLGYNKCYNVFLDEECILNVGGCGSNNYSSIQKAIIDSKDGDTVFVWDYSSPYNENIKIDKQIKLIGEDKNTTIIDGRKKDNVISVFADNVIISNFKIINSDKSWPSAGIKLNSDNNRISGNIISDNNYGIYSSNLDDSLISKNSIINSYDSGIFIPFSSNISISQNIIENNSLKGIFLYDSNVNCKIRNKIYGNTIENNREGIYLWYSYRTDILKNKISNNIDGISFNHNSEYNSITNNTIIKNKQDGIFLNSSSRNTIEKNIITQNVNGINLYYSSKCDIINNSWVGYNKIGLFLNYTTKTYIYNNKFNNNNIYGIYLKYSTKNNIRYNNILSNEITGIYLNFNSRDNLISYNNFINQNKHSFFENTLSNKWNNNYWDDWNKIGFYPIHGKLNLVVNFLNFNWINFDFHPSEYKYL